MEVQESLALPKELTQKYEEAMSRNLDALRRANKMSQNQLKEELERRGLRVLQGNLSQYLSGRKPIPLAIIVHLCDIFKVSLAELVEEDFSVEKRTVTQMPQIYSNDLMNLVPSLGEAFVTDPTSSYFKGYLQTYHVYLFPSQNDDSPIRTGTLRLQAKDSVCEAVLEVNTNKIRDGKPATRVYRGRCIISTSMDAVYILLIDPGKGELSVVNFRHINLVDHPLDCRIACTLLNATGEEHPPTMQRLFLSRTRIDDEHIPLLQTHLYLNGAMIPIRRDQLEALQETDGAYHDVVDELLRANQPHSIYYLSEDDVLSTARRCLSEDGIPLRNPEDPAVNHFLARLRAVADHNRINKASRQADRLARHLLRSLGYFHDHDNDN